MLTVAPVPRRPRSVDYQKHGMKLMTGDLQMKSVGSLVQSAPRRTVAARPPARRRASVVRARLAPRTALTGAYALASA